MFSLNSYLKLPQDKILIKNFNFIDYKIKRKLQSDKFKKRNYLIPFI